MIPFLIILPLILAIAAIVLIGSRRARYARYIALAGTLASLGLVRFIGYGSYGVKWLALAGFTLSITSLVTPISFMLLCVVLIIAPIILLYSFGYMATPSEQRRFYIEMLAFEAAMLAFSISGDFVTLFISWEFLSLISYLLIGFWQRRERSSAAARKAITMVLIGDLAILASMAIIWNVSGTFSFAAIFADHLAASIPLYAASILLIIAVATKSAQFPFQEWLADAMEGPTPVSAFLHSSTMVKAGVFMVILLYPMFALTHSTSILIALSIITIILSTMNAAKETQIKRVIAYSTVQELGLMILAASSGALLACLYFFLVQSFYKALLFFGAGSAMEATGKDDLREISGMRSNRLVYITTLIGVLSLAGFIPFSGFFSSTLMGASISYDLLIYAFISVIGFGTSFYIFRWLFMASKRPSGDNVPAAYAQLPRSMMAAMAIMAILAMASSAAFFYLPAFLGSTATYLSGVLGKGAISVGLGGSVLETILAALGALAGYLAYVSRKQPRHAFLTAIVYNKNAVNTFYAVFAAFFLWFSSGVAAFDTYLDAFFEGVGRMAVLAGERLRKASSGDITIYLAALSLSFVAILSLAYLIGAL